MSIIGITAALFIVLFYPLIILAGRKINRMVFDRESSIDACYAILGEYECACIEAAANLLEEEPDMKAIDYWRTEAGYE